ncbi:MAG: hypothetical protein J6P72_00525 [Firmicutes bacterium]|nr:hypothetical protein [Bacillota bacterium]
MSQLEREETIDLMQILVILKQHWFAILLSTVLCGVIGYAYASLVIKPTYSANADMFVTNNQNINSTQSITNADISASSSLVDTYAVILKSHDVLEDVIAELKLPYTYNALASNVSVGDVSGTQVMRITVRSESPEEAIRIVSSIVDHAPEAITKAMNVGSVAVVDSPWSSGKPVAPNKRNYGLVGAMIGFVICFGILFLREITNSTFKSEEDVRKVLDLPMLGIIPLDDSQGQPARAKSKKRKKKQPAKQAKQKQ